MTLSLLVPQEALPKVYKRLDKLARSAGVLCEEIPGTTTLIDGARVLTCARITIGDLPAVGGYEFAARIEHTKDGNVVVRGPAETQDLDESWRTAEPLCSHCSKKRLRKETFLLRQYGVALLQIGRNCLADFLMTDPSRMVALAELVKAIREESDDEHWGSYGGYWEVAPVAFVACAVASTERYGFKKSSEENSTRQHAEWLSGPPPGETYEQWKKEQPTEDQIECAHQIVAWAATPGESASEYRWNLSLAVKQPGIGKHAGLLASAPSSYFRELGRELGKKAPAPRPDGYAVAEKGDVFKGEVTLIRHYLQADDKWSTSKAICTFRTDDGHEIVWYASGIAPKPDMIGMRFQVKGRCKRLSEARGNYCRQTVLARVTWKPVVFKEEEAKSA